MSDRLHAPHVGAPDPERRTSPLIEESDEEFDVIGQEVGEAPACHFNDIAYGDGSYVCSGEELLQCRRGSWVRVDTCVPDNP